MRFAMQSYKCLVTGGAGFIGSNLARSLEKQGHCVTVVDNFSSGHKKNLTGFNGDVMALDVSKDSIKGAFDLIFHQAAITDPRYGNDDVVLQQNIGGFQKILEKAKADGSAFIYASTASLYGNGPSPQKEEQQKELLSAYAQSKLICDEMASYHFDDMQIVGLRYFNVFGPNEQYKGRPASMIYHLTKQMKAGKNPRLFKMGEQARDHIYVKDCVLANVNAIQAPSGIYNVGTGIATSFNTLVSLLNESLHTDLQVEYIDMSYDPKSYQHHTQADTTRAKTSLKFKAEYSLKKGIEEYIGMI